PVVMLMTASVRCLMTGRKRAKASGDWSGWPVIGFRACRWTIAAPASAASTAASAISSGVAGRGGDIEGGGVARVPAQVMSSARDPHANVGRNAEASVEEPTDDVLQLVHGLWVILQREGSSSNAATA